MRNDLMWQDAPKTQLVTAIGQSVRVWQSLQGLDAILASVTAAVWNGSGLTFSTGQYYDAALGVRSQPETIVVVLNPSGEDYGRITDSTSSSNQRLLIVWGNTTQITTRSGGMASTPPPLIVPNNRVPAVFCAVFNGAESIIRWNGNEKTVNRTNTESSGIRIGGGVFAGQYYTGTISDLAIFTRALTAPERAAVEAEEQALYEVTW
jgi:hypothetical protein